MIRVATLTTNTKGRDFVIGDLHGHYDQLTALLEKNHFDATIDRVISTGDLCDRGPRSWDCLQLHLEPWFYGVLGNHESHLLGLASLATLALRRGVATSTIVDAVKDIGKGMDSEWFAEWVSIEVNHSKLSALIELLQSIPHVIAVRGEGCTYNVVHAELLKAGIDSDHALDSLQGNQKDDKPLLWSGSLITESREQQVEATSENRYDPNSKLSITFCGHNVVPKPVAYKNHLFIDTGCGFEPDQYPELEDCLGLTAVILPDFEIAFEKAKAQKQRKSKKSVDISNINGKTEKGGQ